MPKSFPFLVVGFAAAIAIGVSVFCTSSEGLHADDKPQQVEAPVKTLAEKLIGTWILNEASTPGEPSGIDIRLKSFTGTHWMVTQPDLKTGEVIFHHGGRYTLEGETMKTTTEFAAESTKSLIGRPGSFKIEVDGDTLKQTDANGVFNETWKRAK
jgi:hypothetical protein